MGEVEEKETFEEFAKRIKKVDGPRVHKITNSYGVYDAFKYYRKIKPSDKKFVLSESQYFAIIRQVNAAFAELLSNGHSISLPLNMGTIEIRKYKREPRLDEEGKLVYNAPLDWDKSLKMWYEHSNAFNEKLILKQESGFTYRIRYSKLGARYKNQTYFLFKSNRAVRKAVSDNIKNGRIDAFDAYRNKK